jgi:hypothetical protein
MTNNDRLDNRNMTEALQSLIRRCIPHEIREQVLIALLEVGRSYEHRKIVSTDFGNYHAKKEAFSVT